MTASTLVMTRPTLRLPRIRLDLRAIAAAVLPGLVGVALFLALWQVLATTGLLRLPGPWELWMDERSRYLGQPYFVSEYGGTKLDTAAGEGGAWGYGSATTSVDEFLARYKRLTDALLDNPNMFAFCYSFACVFCYRYSIWIRRK